jgi:hypothetical protein
MILPCWYLIIVLFVGVVLTLLGSQRCLAQFAPVHLDSIPKLKFHADSAMVDSNRKIVDTAFKNLKADVVAQKNAIANGLKKQDSALRTVVFKKPSLKIDSAKKKQLMNPYDDMLKLSGPFFRFNGGYLAYNYNYRSSTDTPYAEKNISQNMVNASMNFTIEKYLPFTANFYLSRSNSQFFRNITDLQIVFNAASFRNQFAIAQKQIYNSLTDSLHSMKLENALLEKKNQLLSLRNLLQNPFSLQKLIQANETINIPGKSHDPSLPDSANAKRTDSLQSLARTYIKDYNSAKSKMDLLQHQEDSLVLMYNDLKSLVSRYKSALNGGAQNASAIDAMEDSLRRFGVKNTSMPEQMNWLLGVRNFAVGKTSVNYTELTAKNISLTGVNFEYNTWYYLAVCAGLINYRFNDPVVNSQVKTSQYMYMVRAGIGKIENNHFILSVYQGKKQLFTAADSSGSLGTIPVTGISAETQVRLNPYSYVVAEYAQSFSPDYHFSPVKQSPGFGFSDNTNKAFSLKAYGFIPVTNTRVEGGYKYMGSNFQSFSFFQTNAMLKSWYVKVDQYVWKRKLRLTASVKTSDFSNPYIIQNYNGNTVFTSLNASFRSKGFPSIMVGYMPMSQLTAMGTQIIENKFQTLTANINHYYKIGSIRASSTGVFTKFYNGGTDTSFVFYNASNILLQQSFFFKDFTGSINFSRSESMRYTLNVVGEQIDFPFSKKGSVGIGIKLNNYNQIENKIGQVFNLNYQLGQMDYISLSLERGYLPGSSGVLVHNDFGNIQFIKRFK